MLKKIPIQQLRLGMYIHNFDGSWLSHPFWKTRFLLQDGADLAAILKSGVAACWIDLSKGVDVAQAPLPASAAGASDLTPASNPSTPEASPAAALRVPTEPGVRVSLEAELQRAAGVISRSREKVTALFGEARMGRAVDTGECMDLVEDIAGSVMRNPSALISLARLKTADDYTYMHSVAVCALMVSLAHQLKLDERQTREAGFAGLLHDIGKMAMPMEVLNKPGSLSDAEFKIMQSHPQRGHDILKGGSQASEASLDVCLHHHEKMDGSGYPFKLSGDKISLFARMGAVCDVYDAITSTRPYKNAWDPAGSIQRMAQWQGHFDPVVFQNFVKSVGIFPVGTLVKLASGRLAVVVDQNPANLVAPMVRVFYSTRSKMPIPVQLLDLSQASSNDKIVSREAPQDWGFKQLDELWSKPAA